MLKKVLLVCSLATLAISCSDEAADNQPQDVINGGPGAQGALGSEGSLGADGNLGANGIASGTANGVTAGSIANGANKNTGSTTNAALGNGKTLFVKVPHLYVRTGPGMKFQPVGTIPFNKQVVVVESLENGRWIKIGEGQYVGGKYLSNSKSDKPWIPANYAH